MISPPPPTKHGLGLCIDTRNVAGPDRRANGQHPPVLPAHLMVEQAARGGEQRHIARIAVAMHAVMHAIILAARCMAKRQQARPLRHRAGGTARETGRVGAKRLEQFGNHGKTGNGMGYALA